MKSMLVINYLLNGIIVGTLYGLVGISIVIIYKSTKVLNFAVGSLLTFGGLISFTLLARLHMSLWIALPLAVGITGILGAFVERLSLRPLLAQPILVLVMATLFIDSVLTGCIYMLWKTYTHIFPPNTIPGTTIKIGSIFINHEAFYACIAALICFVLIGFFFKKTQTGLKMRATAESSSVAMVLGINVTHVFSISWILAVAVGTLAGFLLGNRVGLQATITPAMAFRALPGIILGGFDSIGGAIIGGIIVGVLEQMAGGMIGSNYAEVSPYIILLLILFIKPEGLFGTKRIERI